MPGEEQLEQRGSGRGYGQLLNIEVSRRTEVVEVVVRGFVILQAREDDSDIVYGYFIKWTEERRG